MSVPMSGMPDPDPNHTPEVMAVEIEEAKKKLRAAVRGDDAWRHPDLAVDEYDQIMQKSPLDDIDAQEAAEEFMEQMGMTPTPDAVGQLLEAFVPCLRIMCERGYEPNGALWRKAGIFGVLWDVRKKFERLWYRTWTLGIRHDDSAFDLMNFVGMLVRVDPNSRFGDAGEPAGPSDD